MAVSEASFNTWNDSISSILISSISLSKPSTSTRALVLAPKVEIPRIQNSEVFWPGAPLLCMDNTPGTFTAKALAEETAPVTVIFFCSPVPVITTSSNTLDFDSCIITVSVFLSFISISWLSKPMYETIRRWYNSTFILNFPSILVITPSPGTFFTTILAPIRGSLFESSTIPDTSISFTSAWFCAVAWNISIDIQKKIIIMFFIRGNILILKIYSSFAIFLIL